MECSTQQHLLVDDTKRIRRSITYIPGLISLLLLFPVSYVGLQKSIDQPYVLDVVYYDYKFYDPFSGRNFDDYRSLQFTLTGNDTVNQHRLQAAADSVTHVRKMNDTSAIVRIQLNSESNIQSFTRAIEIASIAKDFRVMDGHGQDDEVLILPTQEISNNKLNAPFCGTDFYRVRQETQFINAMPTLPLSFWPVWILGVILALAQMRIRQIRKTFT